MDYVFLCKLRVFRLPKHTRADLLARASLTLPQARRGGFYRLEP